MGIQQYWRQAKPQRLIDVRWRRRCTASVLTMAGLLCALVDTADAKSRSHGDRLVASKQSRVHFKMQQINSGVVKPLVTTIEPKQINISSMPSLAERDGLDVPIPPLSVIPMLVDEMVVISDAVSEVISATDNQVVSIPAIADKSEVRVSKQLKPMNQQSSLENVVSPSDAPLLMLKNAWSFLAQSISRLVAQSSVDITAYDQPQLMTTDGGLAPAPAPAPAPVATGTLPIEDLRALPAKQRVPLDIFNHPAVAQPTKPLASPSLTQNPSAIVVDEAPSLVIPSPAPLDTWALKKQDIVIRSALERWAEDAGYHLLWTIPIDIPIVANYTVKGTFAEAVTQIVTGLKQTDYPVRACFYSNQVLRIVRYIERCETIY
jgi:hypothetical protein